jgi:hypothetical protein
MERGASRPAWRMKIQHDGRLLTQFRLNRRPTADQIAYINARDPQCRFGICRRDGHWCDLDHIRGWNEHGISHEDNYQKLCHRHNLGKIPRADGGYFQVIRTSGGVVWVSPRGLTYPVSYNGHEFTPEQREFIQHLVDKGETRALIKAA